MRTLGIVFFGVRRTETVSLSVSGEDPNTGPRRSPFILGR